MANGEPFDLNKFLSETPVGERFVTEQEVNEGKYPQVRSGVWKEYANREPRFYASVAFNGAFWPFASARDGNYRNLQMWYYRGNTNGRTNASDKWQPTGIGMMKYINPKDCNTNNGKIYDKVDCAIRYADILLMYAEALNEISYSNLQNSEAMVALNAVHTRAGLSPLQITELPDQDSFRKAIMLERQQEFPYEGQRWFDLVRMGGAKEAMKAEGHIIQDYQFLYPIPKTELERINNTELLWQNTGY